MNGTPKYVINPVTKKRISVSGAVFKALTKAQQAQALGGVAQKSPKAKATPKKTAKSKKAPKGEWSEWGMKEYNNELNTHANQYGQMKSSPDYSVYFDYHGVGGFHLTQSKVSKLKGVCLWTEKKGDEVVIHAKGTLPIHILDCALEEWFKAPDYLLNAVSAVIFEGAGPNDDQIRKTFPKKNFKYLIDNNYLWGEFYFTLGELALRACTFTSEELVVDDLLNLSLMRKASKNRKLKSKR